MKKLPWSWMVEKSPLNLFTKVGAPLSVALIFACSACQTPTSPQAPSWRQTLQEELPVLGHRNWILVADSAYPAQTSPGVRIMHTGTSHLEVVDAVLKAVDDAAHVQGVIHLDAELDHVPEAQAPGVGDYKQQLKQRLEGRNVVSLPHEELIAKLDEAGKVFRVLVLKTDLTIPYTSVFFQLDCGYWGPNEEAQMRKTMETKP